MSKSVDVIKKLMNEKGVKVSEVSTATGISYTTLCSFLKRGTKLKLSTAFALANYFGVTVESILGNTDIKKSSAVIAEDDDRLIKEELWEAYCNLSDDARRMIDTLLKSKQS